MRLLTLPYCAPASRMAIFSDLLSAAMRARCDVVVGVSAAGAEAVRFIEESKHARARWSLSGGIGGRRKIW